jgi:hypothetical protein
MPRSRAADNWPSLSPNAAGGRTLSTVFGECSRRSLVRQMTSEYVAGLLSDRRFHVHLLPSTAGP